MYVRTGYSFCQNYSQLKLFKLQTPCFYQAFKMYTAHIVTC